MATRTRKTSPAPVETPETPINSFSPSGGGNAIAAAWRGLYNLFGARYDSIAVSPEGFTFNGLIVDEAYDLDTIISDIYRRGDKTTNPRLGFTEIYLLMSNEIPAPFTNADQLTAWMVKFMKGGSRSPKYAKDAIQNYKTANGFAVPRGRPRKNFHIKDVASLDENALKELSPQEVEKLRGTLNAIAASQAQAIVEV